MSKKENIHSTHITTTPPNVLDGITNTMLSRLSELLEVKGLEYRRNNDPLHNFNRGVIKSNFKKSREEVIQGFKLKHEISIEDLKDDIHKGIHVNEAQLFEKYGDVLIYTILEMLSLIDKNKLLQDE